MTSRSLKDLSLDDLEKMIQFRKDKHTDESKLEDKFNKKDSFLKESIHIINGSSFMPSKQSSIHTSSLQIALKEMQATNKELEERINELGDELRRLKRVEK